MIADSPAPRGRGPGASASVGEERPHPRAGVRVPSWRLPFWLPALAFACGGAHRGVDSGFRRDTFDTGRRQDTEESAEAHSLFPLGQGWSWTYNAPDGSQEHRETRGSVVFNDLTTKSIYQWQSSDEIDVFDEATAYYLSEGEDVYIVGIEHPNASDPTSTETITYEPPVLFVPGAPATTPRFSTSGTVRLVVTDSAGNTTQDTTIPWSTSAAVAFQLIATPIGTFPGWRITYSPGGALAFAEGVGVVDLGAGRMLTAWQSPD